MTMQKSGKCIVIHTYNNIRLIKWMIDFIVKYDNEINTQNIERITKIPDKELKEKNTLIFYIEQHRIHYATVLPETYKRKDSYTELKLKERLSHDQYHAMFGDDNIL